MLSCHLSLSSFVISRLLLIVRTVRSGYLLVSKRSTFYSDDICFTRSTVALTMQCLTDISIQHDNDNIDADFSRCRYVLPFSDSAHVQLVGSGNWETFDGLGALLVHGRKFHEGNSISNTSNNLCLRRKYSITNYTHANSILYCSPKSHSAPSRSLREPKSKTDPFHNGSV
ncbi:hypothetical protein EYC80_000418 [Monilinia laxa]|uniref:LAGLIDADG endonuclease n=1 Tax=Monilinia laxa TaxID=61186 RepID=A0A5N6KAI5_MONLA|nr:hypothetical protein EYC80_000418 [Monilinia laxa]